MNKSVEWVVDEIKKAQASFLYGWMKINFNNGRIKGTKLLKETGYGEKEINKLNPHQKEDKP